MRKFAILLSSLATLALAVPAHAQRDFSAVEIRTEIVAPGIAVLFGSGGNIGVSYGADGTVLIDDQFAPLTPKIEAAIAALGASPVRFLINTHWHGDHSGGNENFGKAGALIVAQEHVRDRLLAGQAKDANAAPAALPVITYHDGIALHLNGAGLRTIHAPHAHTDGDSIIVWKDANVVHMGDTFFNQISLPYIDLGSGGSAQGMLAAANRVLAMIDDKTVVIPGHGPVSDKAGLKAYRDMLADVIGRVGAAREAGKTLDEIVAMKPAARYEVKDGFISGDAFTTAVFKSFDTTFSDDDPAMGHDAAAEHRH